MLIFGGVLLQYDLLEFHVFLTKKIWGWVVLRGKLFLQSSFWVVKGDFTKWWRKWGASIQVVGGIEHYSSRSLKGLFFLIFYTKSGWKPSVFQSRRNLRLGPKNRPNSWDPQTCTEKRIVGFLPVFQFPENLPWAHSKIVEIIIISGQIITTSHDPTPKKGSLEGEVPLLQVFPGWWIICELL